MKRPWSRDTYERIHAALVTAQDERNLRRDWTGNEVGWMIYERLVVWGAANKILVERDLPMLPLEVIERAESSAAGHSDYTKKFAMYVADMIEEKTSA